MINLDANIRTLERGGLLLINNSCKAATLFLAEVRKTFRTTTIDIAAMPIADIYVTVDAERKQGVLPIFILPPTEEDQSKRNLIVSILKQDLGEYYNCKTQVSTELPLHDMPYLAVSEASADSLLEEYGPSRICVPIYEPADFDKATVRNMMDAILHEIYVGSQPTGKTQQLVYSYNSQRRMILELFDNTGGANYSVNVIMQRLLVIEALYSTQAGRSYFSFESMANDIRFIGSEDDARRYFYGLVNGKEDEKKLFSKIRGIHKNLSKGSAQPSILSKYAYFCLLQQPQTYPLGFPIYDSLAREMYPIVCKALGVVMPLKENVYTNTQKQIPIEDYICSIQELRKAVFDDEQLYNGQYEQFDVLDAYLWRMGKVNNGNVSLLMTREEYEGYVRDALQMEGWTKPKDSKSKFDSVAKDKLHIDVAVEEYLRTEFPFIHQLLKHWQQLTNQQP